MKIITGDLAKADPDAAAERLMRFLATADRTLARAGGAQFEAAQVYHAAAEALPGLIARLSAEEVGSLADRLYELAARSRAGVVMKPMRESLRDRPPLSSTRSMRALPRRCGRSAPSPRTTATGASAPTRAI